MKLTLENQPLEVTFACRIEDAWVLCQMPPVRQTALHGS